MRSLCKFTHQALRLPAAASTSWPFVITKSNRVFRKRRLFSYNSNVVLDLVVLRNSKLHLRHSHRSLYRREAISTSPRQEILYTITSSRSTKKVLVTQPQLS